MRNKRHDPEDDAWSEMEPHDKFLELCAISTSGDLTAEEQKDLRTHVAECAECRQALKEFEATASVGMPLLHSHLASSDSLESICTPLETAKATATSGMASIETA